MEKTWREGQVVWRELICPDVAKAKAFYGELCGWSFRDVPMGDFTYTLVDRGTREVAGMMPAPQQMGRAAWMSYVSVKDVDATIRAAEQRGGKSPMPPSDVPGIGRFGVISDPTGAYLGLYRAADGDGAQPGMPSTGEFCWETLNTTDVEQSKSFYTEVIGWSAGPMGENMTVLSAGSTQVADIEPAHAGVPSHWMTHVVIEQLEAAREKAEKLGAKILVPVIAIPGVGRICLVEDPVGAVISIFEPGRPAA